MSFILGKKLKMSQIWKGEKIIPVTIIEAGPVTVTQIKNKEKDGYKAIQVGFGSAKKVKKPQAGHLKNLGKLKHLREFRTENSDFKIGDAMDVSLFKEGDRVKVSAKSKGRGFQGGVKRHGFHGGPKTHGQKNRHRAPGSIGATAPQRVMPGRKMAGRMGGVRSTIKNLRVVSVDKEKNLLFLKGAVPGNKNSLLEISSR